MTTALVTGSTSGIGAAVVRRLVADGWQVVVNSVRSVDAGHALVEELGAETAHYVQADVSVLDDAQRLVDETVDRFGGLDALVNNAGTTQRIAHEDLETATPEVFRRLFDVNVVGAWQTTVAAMPHLRAGDGGCVVNVSSLAGVRPTGSSIPYAVSKAALNHLTVLLANVVGPQVRVNAVAPGLIDNTLDGGLGRPACRRARLRTAAALRPAGRRGRGRPLAGAVGLRDRPGLGGRRGHGPALAPG